MVQTFSRKRKCVPNTGIDKRDGCEEELNATLVLEWMYPRVNLLDCYHSGEYLGIKDS